ncbi:ribonuclease P protein component 3 [Methanofervidicoccus abyssi]|uniref:Ribonuclease P protein component 3 n=1 Tax=Methanofervidicoccus abyssi TaxID=2082189 RepID=A0A401HQT0_9EURY|nr:RNase P subunit p30 family protein [Methanofervidicoccus abyssi]GBF36608.1 ribonuclease P/MRP protein subunit RPP1 [Methanofervidicoccus abyssi]
MENPVDINHIFDEKGIKLLKELGWHGSIVVQYHDNYDKKIFEEVKEYGEREGLKIYAGVKIKSESPKELVRYVKKFRSKVDVILVEGGILKINRQALELHDVDILSTPELNRRDSGIDHVLARLGSVHRVAIELNFKQVLIKRNLYERARLLWAFRRNIHLAKKFNMPVVISSGAENIYGIKSPYDLRSFLNTLTGDPVYSKTIMEFPYKIAEYRVYLKRDNVIRYGVEVVEEE